MPPAIEPSAHAVMRGPPTLAEPYSRPKAGSATSNAPKHAPAPAPASSSVHIPGECSPPAQPTERGSPLHAREGGSAVNQSVPARTMPAAATNAAAGETKATRRAVKRGPSERTASKRIGVRGDGGDPRVRAGRPPRVVEQPRPQRAHRRRDRRRPGAGDGGHERQDARAGARLAE